jgi:hypothetical protein
LIENRVRATRLPVNVMCVSTIMEINASSFKAGGDEKIRSRPTEYR